MAFINDLEIAELQKSLTTRETANEIIANFLPLLQNSFGEVHMKTHPTGAKIS